MIYDYNLYVNYDYPEECLVNPLTDQFSGQASVGSSNYQNIETYNWSADDVNPNTNYCFINSCL